MGRRMDVITSWAASTAGLGIGMAVGKLGARPERPLELYEFEGCPFCRRARQALSVLDLDAMIYPCPKGGTRYRPIVKERGGQNMFPYLIDPNTGVEMYQSLDIAAYLHKTYGRGSRPLSFRGMRGVAPLSTLASAMRPTKGGRAVDARAPQEPLELYSFEASPYCRIVRETLSILEIPYLLRNVAKGSKKRKEFIELSGKMMVPYLVDPNTGVSMFESGDIKQYLYDTYAQ